MRLAVASIWVVAGCGQALPERAAPAAVSKAPIAAIEVPKAPYKVVPAELGDEGVLDRIPHRAMVKRYRVAWWSLNNPPLHDAREDASLQRDILPVLDERARKLRIVIDDDKARYAVWIAREDAWTTALVPLTLGGIQLEPGVSLEAKETRGATRHVALVDDVLAADAWADARALGEVWVARPSTNVKRSHDALIRLGRGTELRASADAKAAVIGSVLADELVVDKLGETGAFTQVEATRPFVRVRGFVETARVLGPTDDLHSFGTGSGHGFGMSHAVRHEVPAGTCLYEKPDGEVLGVTLEAETRLGAQLRDDNWAMVYIDSPWRVSSMYMKNLETEAGKPARWDSCTEPAVRR